LNTQTLPFPESQEIRIARIDALISALLMGTSGGPLSLSLEEPEKAVLRAVRYMRGLANAMPIREIQQRTSLDARQIKQAVRTLRMSFHLPIGSSKRGAEGGYYIIVTDDDCKAWTKDVLDQVRGELAVLRAAAGHQAGLELLGQLHMEALSAAGEDTARERG